MLKPILVSPTGLVAWQLPDSVFGIMWPGPGSGLYFGRPLVSDGTVTRIRHPSADGQYDNRKDAQKAVDAFIAVTEQTET